MKRYSKLVSSINTLNKIRSIVTAMKNLALIETGKIGRFLVEQKKVLTSIENVAADFFSFHSQYLADIGGGKTEACVLLGSERGFCGEFNNAIVAAYQDYLEKAEQSNLQVLIIGSKLAAKLENNVESLIQLEGPSAAEEIPGAILALLKALENIHPTSWVVVCNEDVDDVIQTNVIKPFAEFAIAKHEKYLTAPLLNVSPETFFPGLLDEYFFALLYKMFYDSFLLENRQRAQHMDGSLQWIDKTNAELVRALNISRQEEITESIEEIMLSVEVALNSKVE